MIESLYEENFAQGRLERTLNLPVTPVMDEETVRLKKSLLLVRFEPTTFRFPKTRLRNIFIQKSHCQFLNSLLELFLQQKLHFYSHFKMLRKRNMALIFQIPMSHEADESCDSWVTRHHVTWARISTKLKSITQMLNNPSILLSPVLNKVEPKSWLRIPQKIKKMIFIEFVFFLHLFQTEPNQKFFLAQ